jgi:hypothetical protein
LSQVGLTRIHSENKRPYGCSEVLCDRKQRAEHVHRTLRHLTIHFQYRWSEETCTGKLWFQSSSEARLHCARGARIFRSSFSEGFDKVIGSFIPFFCSKLLQVSRAFSFASFLRDPNSGDIRQRLCPCLSAGACLSPAANSFCFT